MARYRQRVEYGITRLDSGLFWVRLRGKALGSFPTVEQARARRDAVVQLIRAMPEEVVPVAGVTLGQLYKTSRKNRVADGYRNIAMEDYLWTAHIAPVFELVLVKEIRSKDVQDFLRKLAATNTNHQCKAIRDGKLGICETKRSTGVSCPNCGLVQKKLSRSSRKNILNLLRTTLELGVQDGTIHVNPARGITIRKEARKEKTIFFLTTTQQEQLLAATPLPQRHFVHFAICTGLRLGELYSLEMSHIHLDAAQPYVEVRYGGANRAPTKTGEPRDVPLLPPAIDALKAWLGYLPIWCRKNPLGLVFPRQKGAHGRRKAPQHWKDWVADANLGRRLRWHDLRHTCACALLNGQFGRKWSMGEVQRMLGHASVTTTEIYAHLLSSTLMLAATETATMAAASSGQQQSGRNQAA